MRIMRMLGGPALIVALCVASSWPKKLNTGTAFHCEIRTCTTINTKETLQDKSAR
jgi:hypothetical protein